MSRGFGFLKQQIDTALELHAAFIRAMGDHADQADDIRYRDFCLRSVPLMEHHRKLLQDYRQSLGVESEDAITRPSPSMIRLGRDLADSRESDYGRLVGDIVAARQLEDLFKTFREAGRMLGDTRLFELGEVGEAHHDDMVREGNRLAQMMFVEHVRGVPPGASTESRDFIRRASDLS
jgi:hypothetical protein